MREKNRDERKNWDQLHGETNRGKYMEEMSREILREKLIV